MYVLTELGYVLICQVKERERERERKKLSFQNAIVEKSESSTKNKNGLVEGLLLFSIQMFTFTDLSRKFICISNSTRAYAHTHTHTHTHTYAH